MYFRFFSAYKNLNLTFAAFASNADLSTVDNDSTILIQLILNSFGVLTPVNKNLKKTVLRDLSIRKLLNLPHYLFISSLTPLYNTLVILSSLHTFKLK